MSKVAILIDGGFYRRMAVNVWGEKTPQERARELIDYCYRHMEHIQRYDLDASLYRIFYYDCPPYAGNVYHPLLKKDIRLEKTLLFKWMDTFLKELTKQRKLALRLGTLSSSFIHYDINQKPLKRLLRGEMTVDDLNDSDFDLSIVQKGVDMKIGIDISSLAYKKQVDTIVLISNDSDFVPASRLARREGIDFILDPMWNHVKPDLFEHIDGLYSCFSRHSSDRR